MKTITFLAFLLACVSLSGQSLITLVHNGQSRFFPRHELDSAHHYAVAGDTILLGGGDHSLAGGNFWINKPIHIIGVGFRPDSSWTTQPSRLIGNVTISEFGSNTSLTGIHINGTLRIGGDRYTYALNVKLIRCKVDGSTYLERSNGWHQRVRFLEMRECVINAFFGDNTTDHIIMNNVFSGDVQSFESGTIFIHNIFLSNVSGTDDLTFKHNIFCSTISSSTDNCLFYNNMFVNNSSTIPSDNLPVNNLFNQSLASLFLNYSGGAFSFQHDFHLQASSPANTWSIDGGPVGIYGGTDFKQTAHPATPRIISRSIGTRTDSLGRLPVRILVKANDH